MASADVSLPGSVADEADEEKNDDAGEAAPEATASDGDNKPAGATETVTTQVTLGRVAYMEDADDAGDVLESAERTEARLVPESHAVTTSPPDNSSSRSHVFPEEPEGEQWVDEIDEIEPSDSASAAASNNAGRGPKYPRLSTVEFEGSRPDLSLEKLFPGRCEDLGTGRVRILRPWELPHSQARQSQSMAGTNISYDLPPLNGADSVQTATTILNIPPGQASAFAPGLGLYNHLGPSRSAHSIPTAPAWEAWEQRSQFDDLYDTVDPPSYYQPSTTARQAPPSVHAPDPHTMPSTGGSSVASGLARSAQTPSVVSLPLTRSGVRSRQLSVTPWTKAWHESTARVGVGGETELIVVGTVGHYADESGETAITLARRTPGEATTQGKSTSMRWLHLTRPSLNLKDLEELVFHCPHVSDDIKSVALPLLEAVQAKMVTASANGTFFKPGSAIRYDGKHTYDPLKVDESVIFFSAPYLLCKMASKHGRADEAEHSARTLLQFLYNYEPGDKREINQVISKAWKSTKDVLHVSQLWCMLLGSDIILTCAEIPLSDILGPSIDIDKSLSPCTIRLDSWDFSRRHYVAIEPPIPYAEFRRRVLESTPIPQTATILDGDRLPLDAEKWLELMEIDGLEELSFYFDDREYGVDDIDPPQSIRQGLTASGFPPSSATLHDDYPHISTLGRNFTPTHSRFIPTAPPSLASRGNDMQMGLTMSRDRRMTDRTHASSRHFSFSDPGSGSRSIDADRQARLYSASMAMDYLESPVPGSPGDASDSEDGGKLPDSRETTDLLQNPSSSLEPLMSQSLRDIASGKESRAQHRATTNTADELATNAPFTTKALLDPSIPERRGTGKSVGFETAGAAERGSDGADTPADSRPMPKGKETEQAMTSSGVDHNQVAGLSARAASEEREGAAPTKLDNEAPKYEPRALVLESSSVHGLSRRHAVPTSTPQPLTRENLRGVWPQRLQTLYTSGNVVNDWTSISEYADTYHMDTSGSETEDAPPGPPTTRNPPFPPELRTNAPTRNPPMLRSILKGPTRPDRDNDISSNSSFIFPPPIAEQRRMRGVRFQSDDLSSARSQSSPSHSIFLPNTGWDSPLPPSSSGRRRSYVRSTVSGTTSRPVTAAFFTWNVSHDRESKKQGVTKVFRLLNRIGTTLSEEAVSKRLYETGFECTLQELRERHSVLLEGVSEADDLDPTSHRQNDVSQFQTDAILDEATAVPREQGRTPVTISEGRAVEGKAPAPQTPSDNLGNRTTPSSNSDATGLKNQPEEGEDQLGASSGEGQSIEKEARMLLRDLFDVSRNVMGLFVPESMGSPHMHNTVLKKYWGSLDRIFRLVRVLLMSNGRDSGTAPQCATAESSAPRSSFIISFQLASPHLTDSDSGCAPCGRRHEYDSLEAALDHLHTGHGHGSHASKFRPADDPCVVWIQTRGNINRDLAAVERDLRPALSIIREFIDYLGDLQRGGEELHMFIAVQPLPGSAKAKDLAENKTPPSLPSLPSGVVHAFEEIVSLHLHMAQRLSLASRRRSYAQDVGHTTQETVFRAGEKCRRCFTQATNLFESAKRVLIMPGAATAATRGINLEPVGPHYLVMVVLAHLQNRALTPTHSVAPGLSSSFSSRQRSSGGGHEKPLQALHMLDLYADYANMLQYQVNQRPRRRLFLDIRGLEEELEAMAQLARTQQALFDKLTKVFDPATYRIATAARRAMYTLETRSIDRQRTKLWEKELGYHSLQEKGRDLKEQVRQSLEILEEGHGKAIRVFTIVTLFFLPLTFVSGFMGMNTADIRNTDQDQTFFWIVALPLTVGVMTIAFVYGYRGDAIGEFLSDALEAWHARSTTQQRRRTIVTARVENMKGERGDEIGPALVEETSVTADVRVGEKEVPGTLYAATRNWFADAVQNPRLRSKEKANGPLLKRTTEDSLA